MRKILKRIIRKVELPKGRINLSADALKSIGIDEDNCTVMITVYDDKIVITNENTSNRK